MTTRRRCNWCGRFVPQWMPAFTWNRQYGKHGWVGGEWKQVGPDYGWTRPQILCPDDAYFASTGRLGNDFAEIDP